MKLARLLLQAFGPFTDTEIDFAGNGEQPEANLHLIYGPNEAGKSSALRAMTDLRFGIHLRSPDDFVHPSSQLRIAGVFIDAGGENIGLVRRKGRGATLARFDIETGLPATSPDVPQEIEQALKAGLERDEFEAMFGLNHERLRAGGEQLLKGEGELGSALFEASAGTQGIASILSSLEADAKALFNPHGRAQSATINEARRQLEEYRHQWRQAQTRPAEWQSLNRAYQQARESLEEIDRALEAARRQENVLTELRTVAPLLREYDRALAELQTLAEVRDLPEGAREDRLAAEQSLRRALKDLRDAETELMRCNEALEEIVVQEPLLEHAEAIERLANSVEGLARSRVEAQQQQAVIDRIETELAIATRRIAVGRTPEEILNAVPSVGDRVALDQHLGEINRLTERLDGFRKRVEELNQEARIAEEDSSPLPDPQDRQRVLSAVTTAQGLGDVSRLTRELDRDIRELNSELDQTLADLGIESVEALRSARPLLDAQIANARQALSDIDELVRRANEEDLRLEGDLKQQRLRLRQLAAAGEIVTAETLRLARERRDRGWDLIRQIYVESSEHSEDLTREFDENRPLPEAFENAQGEADRQADMLRADATRAAGFEDCTVRIGEMEERRGEIADEMTALSTRRQAWQTDWMRQLVESRLPDLGPEALREWQAARQGALNTADRLAKLMTDRDRLLAEANAAEASLAEAMQAAGQTVQTTGLASLIDQAVRWENQAKSIEAEQVARNKAENSRRFERERVGGQIKKTEDELDRHLTPLRAWHARLFLALDSTPEAVKARLDELDGMARQSAAQAEARLRRNQHQAVVDDFARQVSNLALVLGEPAPELGEDFADRLSRRLSQSRDQDRQRLTLTKELKQAQVKKREAETEQASQMAILEKLCAAAGVESLEKLPEREERANRKLLLQGHLTKQRQQLAQASTRSEDELRERLAGHDLTAIEAERERCRAEISRLEEEQSSARRTEEETRRALEAIDSSDRAATAREAMESAAARYRSAIRPWARLKLAHALLQESLNRFRERAQAPMVAAASTYFSLMTDGRYVRLVADETAEKPVLLAERDDGKQMKVDAMSEGTADQLYLALRLAALELRRESHPQMPLILDDVLVTSDDHRAGNILRALARFAEGGQVMLFTHHRHLIDVARAALGEQGIEIHNL